MSPDLLYCFSSFCLGELQLHCCGIIQGSFQGGVIQGSYFINYQLFISYYQLWNHTGKLFLCSTARDLVCLLCKTQFCLCLPLLTMLCMWLALVPLLLLLAQNSAWSAFLGWWRPKCRSYSCTCLLLCDVRRAYCNASFSQAFVESQNTYDFSPPKNSSVVTALASFFIVVRRKRRKFSGKSFFHFSSSVSLPVEARSFTAR